METLHGEMILEAKSKSQSINVKPLGCRPKYEVTMDHVQVAKGGPEEESESP